MLTPPHLNLGLLAAIKKQRSSRFSSGFKTQTCPPPEEAKLFITNCSFTSRFLRSPDSYWGYRLPWITKGGATPNLRSQIPSTRLHFATARQANQPTFCLLLKSTLTRVKFKYKFKSAGVSALAGRRRVQKAYNTCKNKPSFVLLNSINPPSLRCGRAGKSTNQPSFVLPKSANCYCYCLLPQPSP